MPRIAFLICLPLLLAGCYVHSPAPQSPAIGTRVRAQLTPQGSVDLATYLGPAVEAVSGRVLGTAPDSLVLAITAVDTRRLGENYWNGERVALARESIESMTQKHLSTKRTALFSALVLAGGYALLRAFDIDFRSGDEGVPMPPPQQ